MSNLKKLHTDLINATEACAKGVEDRSQKAKEVSDVKLELTEVKSRIIDIERTLNNARKGIGLPVSVDEFSALKVELEDKKNKLENLTDIIPLHETELKNKSQQCHYNTKIKGDLLSEITNGFATEAASELAITLDSKLKELVYMLLADYGSNWTGSDNEDIYKKVGEALCKQLFSTATGSVTLPTAKKAIAERDLLIENLA